MQSPPLRPWSNTGCLTRNDLLRRRSRRSYRTQEQTWAYSHKVTTVLCIFVIFPITWQAIGFRSQPRGSRGLSPLVQVQYSITLCGWCTGPLTHASSRWTLTQLDLAILLNGPNFLL